MVTSWSPRAGIRLLMAEQGSWPWVPPFFEYKTLATWNGPVSLDL